MLKLRVLSALILAAVVAAAVVFLPTLPLWLFFYLLMLIGGCEWAKLSGVKTRLGVAAYAVALTALVLIAVSARAYWPAALVAVAAFWVLALALLLAYPKSARLCTSSPAMLVAGGIVLPGAWLALATLHAKGAAFVVWLFVATSVADAGAYFVGRQFGRRKLAPRISPGKTWEGLVGGVIATLAWAASGAWFFHGALLAWLGVGAAVVGAAVVGDLFESALKRSRGVKDSGTLLPGHGGVLDRIDSVLAAAPVFALLALAM